MCIQEPFKLNKNIHTHYLWKIISWSGLPQLTGTGYSVLGHTLPHGRAGMERDTTTAAKISFIGTNTSTLLMQSTARLSAHTQQGADRSILPHENPGCSQRLPECARSAISACPQRLDASAGDGSSACSHRSAARNPRTQTRAAAARKTW
jgi:hypothetical protein